MANPRAHLLLAVVVVTAACSPKPARIVVEALPAALHTAAPTVVKAHVVDSGGSTIDHDVELVVTTPDLLAFSGMTITPLKNGAAELTLRAVGTDVAIKTAVKIALVDRLSITCKRNCHLAVGEQIHVDAVAYTGGLAVDVEAQQWASSDPSVVSVSSTGEVQALKAGRATLSATARGAGGDVKAETLAVVSGVPDRVEMICPSISIDAAAADSLPICLLPRGASMQLRALPYAGQEPVSDVPLTFSGLDPKVLEVAGSGLVIGLTEGTTAVRAGDSSIASQIAVEVLAPSKPSFRFQQPKACQSLNTKASQLGKVEELPLPVPVTAWLGDKHVTGHCLSRDAVACLLRPRAWVPTSRADNTPDFRGHRGAVYDRRYDRYERYADYGHYVYNGQFWSRPTDIVEAAAACCCRFERSAEP